MSGEENIGLREPTRVVKSWHFRSKPSQPCYIAGRVRVRPPPSVDAGASPRPPSAAAPLETPDSGRTLAFALGLKCPSSTGSQLQSIRINFIMQTTWACSGKKDVTVFYSRVLLT